MGYAARANPKCTVETRARFMAEANLRTVLALFPDRSTFEQWVEARQLTDEQRAHLESYLPPALQAQGHA